MPELAEFVGSLHDRIMIEVATLTPNTFSEPAKTWSTFATVWANVQPVSGAEPFIPEQFAPIVNYRIDMWFLDGVTPEMRVNWNGRLFDILAAMGRKTIGNRMFLLAKEHV
jgi:SPP1 family predicted phage head-tail adaptor